MPTVTATFDQQSADRQYAQYLEWEETQPEITEPDDDGICSCIGRCIVCRHFTDLAYGPLCDYCQEDAKVALRQRLDALYYLIGARGVRAVTSNWQPPQAPPDPKRPEIDLADLVPHHAAQDATQAADTSATSGTG